MKITTEDTVSDEESGQHIFDDFFVKGIFDCIIETKNQLYLIDWKLSIDPDSQLFESYVLQLGLYHELLKLTNPSKQIRILLVSITQTDEEFPLPYMIKTEKSSMSFRRSLTVNGQLGFNQEKRNLTHNALFVNIIIQEPNFAMIEAMSRQSFKILKYCLDPIL